MKYCIACVLVLFLCDAAWGQDAWLAAEFLDAEGKLRTTKLTSAQGLVTVPLGTEVRLAVDSECNDCVASIVSVQVNGKSIQWTEKPLPAALVGDNLPLFTPGTVVANVKVVQGNETTTGDYLVRFSLPDRWWVIADTVAYAVTRQEGNTPIAGAGAFLDFPQWKFLRATKGYVRWSLVVHLLPPANEGDPADLGIAPLGLGLFDNKLVLGLGWNVSRKGQRPEESNRYFYIGFSASQVLNPGSN